VVRAAAVARVNGATAGTASLGKTNTQGREDAIDSDTILGYSGGIGGNGGTGYDFGGGGGAGVNGSGGGAGGLAWITDAIGISAFSRGVRAGLQARQRAARQA
jgi:hypothetical protein